MIENRFRSIWRARFLLLVLFLYLCTVASSSIFVWENLTPSGHLSELESISGILNARGGSEIRSLANARRIIQDLSTSPSCAYGPTARLLRQCKLIKPKTEDPATERQKMYIQATYGISMAICEARQAKIPTPSACLVFETMLDQNRIVSSVDALSPSEIESCMNVLFNTASWTSYIAFRAQSSDLCDSSRVDYQREELLETFRQATNIVPEILEALQEQRLESHSTMEDLQDMASKVTESQRQLIASNQDLDLQSKERLRQMSQYIDKYVQIMDNAGKAWQSTLKEGVEQASKDLALMHEKARSVQINFSELYAIAAEAVTGMTYGFEVSVETMIKQTTQLVEHILEFDIEDRMRRVHQAIELGQDAIDKFTRTQFAQKQMVEDQLISSQALLEMIKDSHGEFHQIKDTLDLIPTSWFETFNQFRESVAAIRTEARCALVFGTPSAILLLLGRPRGAAVVVLVYLFFRSTWSLYNNVYFSLSSLPISLEDFKILGLCTLGSLGVGGSAALVGSYVLSLLVARRPTVKESNTGDAAAELGERTISKFTVSEFDFATVSRPTARSTKNEVDRFVRASTV